MAYNLYLADEMPSVLLAVLDAFGREAKALASDGVRKVSDVRAIVGPHLESAGWLVGTGRRGEAGIPIARPPSASVRADAAHRDRQAALWIETGRSWTNNGFLEHIVEAIPCSDVAHLAIAVKTMYSGSAAYQRVIEFLDPVLASDRVDWPFRSLLILGY